MSTIAKVLKVLPALGLLGCVSDFSPDPYKDSPYTLTPSADGGGTTKADAKVVTPTKDASSPVDTDSGSEEQAPSEDAGEVTNPPPKAGPCDLSGRWIMTERMISSAFGAKQVSVNWWYLELSQQGDNVVVSKSLMCGGATQQAPGDFFEVKMDDSGAWDGYLLHTNYNGRKGVSKASGDGCEVSFEEDALVRGATTPAYKNRGLALPKTVAEEATADKPGWEDWDGDGRAGITMVASKSADGRMYTSVRTFSDSAGTIAANADNFVLDLNWDQQREVIEYEPPTAFILVSPAERAPDSGQNVAEFGRLNDSQATGDDAAKCEAVRSLNATITPRASNLTEKL